MAKPKVAHPELPKNALGLTRRDYEGANSTLCAGCGHDSITAAMVEACWADALRPQNVVKLSGIGCSSKTTAYFVSGGHGFNSVHGRMPSIATGASAANRELLYIGVSGDGDTLSIGLGQFCHAIRRNLEHGVRHREQRRLRPDQGAVLGFGRRRQHAPRRARSTSQPPIDPVQLAITLGRLVRGAQLLGRQGAAGAAAAGGDASSRLRADRRDLAVRDLQRSRGLDAQLRLHARALRGSRAHRLRAAGSSRSRSTTRRARRRPSPCTTAAGCCCARSRRSTTHRSRRRARAIQQQLKQGEYLTGLLYVDEGQRNSTR